MRSSLAIVLLGGLAICLFGCHAANEQGGTHPTPVANGTARSSMDNATIGANSSSPVSSDTSQGDGSGDAETTMTAPIGKDVSQSEIDRTESDGTASSRRREGTTGERHTVFRPEKRNTTVDNDTRTTNETKLTDEPLPTNRAEAHPNTNTTNVTLPASASTTTLASTTTAATGAIATSSATGATAGSAALGKEMNMTEAKTDTRPANAATSTRETDEPSKNATEATSREGTATATSIVSTAATIATRSTDATSATLPRTVLVESTTMTEITQTAPTTASTTSTTASTATSAKEKAGHPQNTMEPDMAVTAGNTAVSRAATLSPTANALTATREITNGTAEQATTMQAKPTVKNTSMQVENTTEEAGTEQASTTQAKPTVNSTSTQVENATKEAETVQATTELLCFMNITVANAARNTSEAEVNSSVLFRCDKGYSFSPNLSGDVVRELVCQESGELSEIGEMTCERVICPISFPIDNGSYMIKHQGNWTDVEKNGSEPVAVYGDELQLICDDGFTPLDSSNQICNSSGRWDGPVPKCQRVSKCPDSGFGDKLLFTGSREVGGIARFNCVRGFQLNGLDSLRCLENFTWNETLPVCNVINCSSPPDKSYHNASTLNMNGTVYSSQALYGCSPGERGGGLLTCGSKSSWEGSVCPCQPVICSEPNMPQNAKYRHPPLESGTRRYVVGDNISFVCDEGYTNTGNRSMIACSAPTRTQNGNQSSQKCTPLDGEWSENMVVCSALPKKPTVVSSSVQVKEGDMLTVWCNVSSLSPNVSLLHENNSLNLEHILHNGSGISYYFNKSKAELSDNGRFICRASNLAGTVTKAINITILGKLVIEVSTISHDSVSFIVKFSPIRQSLKVEYIVKESPFHDGQWSDHKETPCKRHSLSCWTGVLKVNQLKPYTSYTVSVRAVYSGVIGPSTNLTVRTNESAPPPYDLKKSEVGSPSEWPKSKTSLMFRLLPPSNANGPITQCDLYAVYYGKVDPARQRQRRDVSRYRIGSWEDSHDKFSSMFMYLDSRLTEDLNRTVMDFTIGRTKQLNEGHYYSLVLKIYTQENLSTFSTESSIRRTVTTKLPPATTADDDSGVAVGVLAAFLALVLILIIILITHRKQKSSKDRLLPRQKPKIADRADIALTTLESASSPSDDGTRNPVPIDLFQKHVEVMKMNDGRLFTNEYKTLTMLCKTEEHSVSLKNENSPKNRYANICAYDNSRVVLDLIDGEEDSDYINANFIDGFNKEEAYIATQGPLPNTFDDFWRMVWQVDSRIIVMLTGLEENGRLKCHLYWPKSGTTVKYGAITVAADEEIVLASFVIRSFTLSKDDLEESRLVRQLHFTKWPDHGVPEEAGPLLTFLRKIHVFNPTDAGPIVVHCSAGVGRTGTMIVIDSQLQRAEQSATFDIYNNILAIRKQRIMLVQTEAQYVFIHDALLEAITNENTEIAAAKFQRKMKEFSQRDEFGDTHFQREYGRLVAIGSGCISFDEAGRVANLLKNQPGSLLPPDHTRVQLSMSPGIEGSDYINASYLTGHRSPKAYIAAQAPLVNTAEDFWRMVWEQEACSIAMLAPLGDIDEERRVCYWPEKVGMAVQYGDLLIDLLSEEVHEGFVVRDMNICDLKDFEKNTRFLVHFQFPSWSEGGKFPAPASVVDVIGRLDQNQTKYGNPPIVVHCVTGSGRTGAFCASCEAISRIKMESSVDIFEIVKTMRTQRPLVVRSSDEYTFIYSCVAEYLCSFDMHATTGSK